MSQWVIAGKEKDAEPIVGKEYEIRHTRKGILKGKCLSVSGEWATFALIEGKINYTSRENKILQELYGPPETITVRDQLCYLIEIEDDNVDHADDKTAH